MKWFTNLRERFFGRTTPVKPEAPNAQAPTVWPLADGGVVTRAPDPNDYVCGADPHVIKAAEAAPLPPLAQEEPAVGSEEAPAAKPEPVLFKKAAPKSRPKSTVTSGPKTKAARASKPRKPRGNNDDK